MNRRRFTRIRLAWMIAALVVNAGLAACGSSSNDAGAVGTKENPGEPMHYLTVFHGINALANVSQLAVIGTITQIGALETIAYPKPHDPDQKPTYVERTVQDITVVVERLVFDSPEVTSRPSDTLTFTIEPRGEASRTESGCVIKADEVAGPLAVGDRRLMLFRHYTGFPTADGGTRDILALNGGWQAHWRIEGQMANSKCERRSVPLAALLNRLESERKAGRDPSRDPGTEENPVAPARIGRVGPT